MFSKFFIDRPIFASVLSIIITIAGVAAIRVLPIEQFPPIVPPQIVVSASYPGASTEVIANTVAAPLEEAINGVPNMLYISSVSSSAGVLSIVIAFSIGTSPDQAQIDVNNATQSALPLLPSEVQRYGVTVNKRGSETLQVIMLHSPNKTYDSLTIANYVLTNIIDDLNRIEGVGEAALIGPSNYAMRVWLQSDKMSQYNVTATDVIAAIRDQNAQFALGQFGEEPVSKPQEFTYMLVTQSRFSKAEEFEKIVIRANPNGSPLYLKDVAKVALGAEQYYFSSGMDNIPMPAIKIVPLPGANAIDIADKIIAKMEKLSEGFPPDLVYTIPFDDTTFVRISIREVVITLLQAILLVIMVIFLFLQNPRATLIPIIAIPVALLGSFSGLFVFDFSLNLLTLFAFVLAIGIVVDDAIVVLENFERIMTTEKLSPRAAAIKAMEEVTGPVVAIVLVLCAVFVPIGFLSGFSGQMYRQFSITIAISVVISGLVALTLTPSLCATIVKEKSLEKEDKNFLSSLLDKFFEKFNILFEAFANKYTQGVQFFLNHIAIAITICVMIAGSAIFMLSRLPSSLVPDEDRGYLMVAPMLASGAALNRTQEVSSKIIAELMKEEDVEHAISFVGYDLFASALRTNSAGIFLNLKDWDLRKGEGHDSFSLVKKYSAIANKYPEAIVPIINPPAISGMGRNAGFSFYLQYKGQNSNLDALTTMVHNFMAALQKEPSIGRISTPYAVDTPQYYFNLDREKAKTLNLSVTDIFQTMQTTFGAYYANDFTLFNRTYKVQVQSDAPFRERPEDLNKVFVRSTDGNMIPLSNLLTITRINGPDVLERFNIFPAAHIMGAPATGYTTGQTMDTILQLSKKMLGTDYGIAWEGESFQESIAGGQGVIAVVFGILMVFLILSALYESWSLPLSVLVAVPFAIFGAVVAILLRGLSNDIYFQVGLVTLVGLSAKNAILVVEFAEMELKKGGTVIDAAVKAARLRLRPILMTSLAFIFGCLPLYFSSGCGAASRHSIGTGVIGGMLSSTFLATLFIPLLYVLIKKMAGSTTASK